MKKINWKAFVATVLTLILFVLSVVYPIVFFLIVVLFGILAGIGFCLLLYKMFEALFD